MTRAELVESIAQGMCECRPGKCYADDGAAFCWKPIEVATAALAAIEAAGFVCVERKLLTEARACMRATGWHLAVDAPDSASDGVLEAACSDVEARVRAALEQEGKGDE